LTLQTVGNGKITGVANQASLQVNKVFTATAVPKGNTLFAGWSSGTGNTLSPLPNGATLSFLMASNLVLQANFVANPFTALAGVYNGLFAPVTGVTEESSGFLTATVPATSKGGYSAKLLLDGGSYSFSGKFDLTGQSEKTLVRSSKPPVSVTLQLNLANPDNLMLGSVGDVTSNGWISALQTERVAATAGFAGRYTMLVPPAGNAPADNEPIGYGYVTLSNNPSGHVAISGHLADAAMFSQSVGVADDGNIPLYASLYSGKGSLQGWLTIVTNPLSIVANDLTWIKDTKTTSFTNENISVLGSSYAAPQSGGDALTVTNATLLISNVTSGALIYNNVNVTDNKLTYPESGNPPNKLTGVINPGTGVITVTFKPTGAQDNVVAKGVVLQDDQNPSAAGWFFESDQSGSFLLQQ
jgi:hypothetical protein